MKGVASVLRRVRHFLGHPVLGARGNGLVKPTASYPLEALFDGTGRGQSELNVF